MQTDWHMPTPAEQDRELLVTLKGLIMGLDLKPEDQLWITVSSTRLVTNTAVGGCFCIKMPPDAAQAAEYRRVLIAAPARLDDDAGKKDSPELPPNMPELASAARQLMHDFAAAGVSLAQVIDQILARG
jgi:hypothetical protein